MEWLKRYILKAFWHIDDAKNESSEKRFFMPFDKFLKALFCFRLKWVEMRAKFRKYDYCLAKWNKFVSPYPGENELCHFLSKNKDIFYPKCAFSISNSELKCVESIYKPQQNCQNVFEIHALLAVFLFISSLVLKWRVKQFIWKLILF